MVEHAHLGGKEGVIIGRGKAELKQSLGAELIPQYAVAIR
jgi:hypothetical protein